MAGRSPDKIAPDALDRLVLAIVSGVRDGALASVLAELKIPHAKRAAALQEARRRIIVAADYQRDEEIGKALVRLEELYRSSLELADRRTALAAQKEISKLLHLYPSPAAIAAEPDGLEGRPEGSVDLADVEAARAHLVPLGLAPEDAPLAEHARLAVQRIVELEA